MPNMSLWDLNGICVAVGLNVQIGAHTDVWDRLTMKLWRDATGDEIIAEVDLSSQPHASFLYWYGSGRESIESRC